METARAGQAGVERGIKHAGGLAQTEFGMFGGEALQEILGSDACPAAKEPMEMGRAESGGGGEVAERGLGGVMFIQITDYGGDAFKIIHGSNLAERKVKPTRFLR